MITIESAIEKIVNAVSEIKEAELVELDKSVNRILAEDLYAKINQPPFPRSPLDGYAIIANDTKNASQDNPIELRIIDEIYAGNNCKKTLSSGEAVRIMTGAPIPNGADAVVKQEDTDFDFDLKGKDTVCVFKELKPYENYCKKGEDFSKGNCLVKKGERMNFARIGLAAAMGYNQILVKRKVKAVLFTTGSELVSPGEQLTEGKIYDSNMYAIASRLIELDIKILQKKSIEDNIDILKNEILKVRNMADILLITGGVSVGEKDYTELALNAVGANVLFHGVRMKPGSPMLGAMLDDMCILGLSGNPFAALVALELFMKPLLRKYTNSNIYQTERRIAIAKNDFLKSCKNPRFIRGKWENGEVVFPKNHASGVIESLKDCNCIVKIEAGRKGIKEGEEICVIML